MNMRRWLPGLVALALTASLVPAVPAQAAFPGRNGLLVFSADTGNGYQLYTVRPDGDGLRRITHVTGDAVQPDWSTDGRKIVFELDHPKESGCSVMLMKADGTHAVSLSPPPSRNFCDNQPSFSPDGRTIYFIHYDARTDVEAIWSMNLKGGHRREISRGIGKGVTDPNAAPDGRTLSFVAYNGKDFGQALYTLKLRSAKLRQLTPFTFDVAIKQDWAPDGRRLVFTDNADFPHPGDSANVATIRRDGSGLRYVTHFTGGKVNAFVGGYSPDGRWIVFRLEDHGRFALLKMRPDGHDVRTILPLSSFRPRGIDWGPARGQGDAKAHTGS